MQRLLLNLLAVIFLFVACKRSSEKGIISKSNFIKALTEIQLTDAYLNILPIDSARKVIGSLYQVTFDRYDLDSASFKRNIDYYGKDAQEMQEIYARVEKNLNEENEFYSKIEKHKQDSIRVKDSIQNVHIQDSVNRIQNFKQRYEEQLVLLKNYIPRSDSLSYSEASRDFYKRTGLAGSYNLASFMAFKQTAVPIAPPVTPTAVPGNVPEQQHQAPLTPPQRRKLPLKMDGPVQRPEVLEQRVIN